MYKSIIKPFLDFSCALVILVIASPIILVVTVLLSFSNSGKPFFTQIRPGKNSKLFRIIKFKTMTDALDTNGKLAPDADRLTAIGKFVRATSLDELPQLFNVISGKMSLVGPRPLLPAYLDYYTKEQMKRHDVKPGITGWAQVNGRNSISWEDKFSLDVWYVQNQSFKLDLKILIMTVKKVLVSEGISAEGHETMPTLIEYLESKKKNS